MTTPIVSVCIPSYNSEKYIYFAIDSVLQQQYQNFELIITDDCSTDNTVKIILSYNDERIKFYQNKVNLGPEKNWNSLLNKAKGKYIKLLCDDDVLYPDCLIKQINVLEHPDNSTIIMVSCSRDIINEKGKKILVRQFPNVIGELQGAYAIKKNIRAGTNLIGEPTAVLFRKEVIKKIGFFDMTMPYVIDLEYWSRILLTGNLYVIPEPLCAFRVSNKSCSINLANSQHVDMKLLINKLYKNKAYSITTFDRYCGITMSHLNNILRKLFYQFFLPYKK